MFTPLATNIQQIPINLFNTGLIVIMAIGVNLLYAVGRLKLTDMNKMRRYTSEMKAFRAEMSAATKEGNKQKMERLKKKQQQMSKMQAEMSMQQLKPSLLFMIPLLGVYYLMQSIVGATSVLALSPINIPLIITSIPMAMPFFWWYMICSFAFSGVISRIFGLTMD
ncbi:MAG: EMC3/TMCO1 family protein [Nitrososphaerales archaeon]